MSESLAPLDASASAHVGGCGRLESWESLPPYHTWTRPLLSWYTGHMHGTSLLFPLPW